MNENQAKHHSLRASHRWDIQVSNPPYQFKDRWLARSYALEKPFCLLMPLSALGEQTRGKLYIQHGIQLIVMIERIAFETPSGLTEKTGSSPHFCCAWFCWRMNLPKDLIFYSRREDSPQVELF